MSYQTAMQAKGSKRVDTAIVDAKKWWRSMDASQKEAGFASWKFRSICVVLVRVFLPYTGSAHVITFSLSGKRCREIRLTERQRVKLRDLAKNPLSKKGWFVRQDDLAFELWFTQ